MSSNLNYSLGRIENCIKDDQLDIGTRVFSTLYTADPAYITTALSQLIQQEGVSLQWQSRIYLMLSASMLVSNQVNPAITAFNRINSSHFMAAKDRWTPFYTSTVNYIQKVYTSDSLNRSRQPCSKPHSTLIGDSHVLGISGIAGMDVIRSYLPGIKLSLLASPMDNAVKVALRNALSFAYTTETVILSVGEIDSRSFITKIVEDPQFWQKNAAKWTEAIQKSYEYIAQYRSPLQEYRVIVPPAPSEVVMNTQLTSVEDKDARMNRIIEAVSAFRHNCREAAVANGLVPVEYPDRITTDNGVSSCEYLVDHAHFTLDVYKELLDSSIR